MGATPITIVLAVVFLQIYCSCWRGSGVKGKGGELVPNIHILFWNVTSLIFRGVKMTGVLSVTSSADPAGGD